MKNLTCVLIHLSNFDDYDDVVKRTSHLKNADFYFAIVYGWKKTFDECVNFICSKRNSPFYFSLVENNNLTDSNGFLNNLLNIDSDDYKYVVKLHNKTVVSEREKSFNFVNYIDTIIEKFEENEMIGMCGTEIETLSPETTWNKINEPDITFFRELLNLSKSQDWFDTEDYKFYNSDLRKLNQTELINHYIRYGKNEKRATSLKTGSFVIVTMFISRLKDLKNYFTTSVIRKILELGQDKHYVSGVNLKSTPAHAMERIYGNIFIDKKYVIPLSVVVADK